MPFLFGTTSACAENTKRSGCRLWPWRNYLRVRGEYPVMRFRYRAWLELPPRARRILGDPAMTSFGRGTTSACAENTATTYNRSAWRRNYLRVRGEYRQVLQCNLQRAELPPRARRIPRFRQAINKLIGTTSACAENTGLFIARQPQFGNYLRVRGEYLHNKGRGAMRSELPPRARRILHLDCG
ncbi:Uncharacterised protein [Corynebacterium matruchotii]|nr:Uncharacterised protein [Corynebacterium matruchotii]